MALAKEGDSLMIGEIAARKNIPRKFLEQILLEMKRHGIDCPSGVSVTGFNDMYLSDRIDPPLTTVRIQQYEVGLKAAEALLRHIDAGDEIVEPVHDVLPVELVVRQSTAPLATAPLARL